MVYIEHVLVVWKGWPTGSVFLLLGLQEKISDWSVHLSLYTLAYSKLKDISTPSLYTWEEDRQGIGLLFAFISRETARGVIDKLIAKQNSGSSPSVCVDVRFLVSLLRVRESYRTCSCALGPVP